MANQMELGHSFFRPRTRKLGGSKKNAILKKSLKQYQHRQLQMQSVSRVSETLVVNCKLEDRRGNQEDNATTKEDPSTPLSNGNPHVSQRDLGNKSRMSGTGISNFQGDKASCIKESMKTKSVFLNRGQLSSCDGKTNNHKSKKRRGQMFETMPETNDHHREGVAQLDNQSFRPIKKARRRRVILDDEDDGGEEGVDDHNHVDAEDDSARSISEYVITKDGSSKVHMPLCAQQQGHCCLKPIDEPIWRGIFKIGSKKYVSLAGHLSTRCGEKVWKLSSSLAPLVQVTKLSRSEAWPKGWEASSKPNGNNIGLYFFPHEMRPNKELDQLVKEVIEKDLVLRAIIGEAEMLIFPSILLPQKYQKFQSKHYLWGIFKPREDKSVVATKQLNVGLCAPKVEKKIQHASNHQEKAHCENLDQEATPMNSGAILMKSEATTTGTNSGMVPTSHGQLNPTSLGLSRGKIFGFVIGQTPRLHQIIQELEREGGVVVAMQGEMIGPGSWPSNAATTN